MVSKTNEKELEIAIEKQLTGTCLEMQQVVAEGNEVPFTQHHDYQLGLPQDFNARYAIDTKRFFSFPRSSVGMQTGLDAGIDSQ
jgi:type I restriction enzyme R subunit